MHVLNYCLFLYFRHNLNKRQNFSNSTTCRCRLCKSDFFNIFLSIFNHLSSIYFLFFNFIIRWSILGSTFLSKSLCIYNDIKKVIQYFWIVICELIWNLIFPRKVSVWVCVWKSWSSVLLGMLSGINLRMWSNVNWNQRYMWGSDSNKIS